MTVGAAVARFRSFAGASVPTGSNVRYLIEDGVDWEIGLGTYTVSGTTLTRSITAPGCSSSTGSLLNLSGNATAAITIASIDMRNGAIVKKSADQTGINASQSPIAWDAEVYDDAAWHDNVTNNGRLTVPSGVERVQLGCNLSLGSVDDNMTMSLNLLKNGASWQTRSALTTFRNAGSNQPRLTVSTGAVDVVAGDYFEVSISITGDTSFDITANSSNFWIMAV